MEEAKTAYIESMRASRFYNTMRHIAQGLPKKTYSHRKRKQTESKHNKFQKLVLQAYVKARNANERFQKAAGKLSDEDAVKLMHEMQYAYSI